MPRLLKKDREKLVIRRPGFLREALEDLGQAESFAEAGLQDQALEIIQSPGERRKIVSVSTDAEFPPALMRQALSLAERLKSEVVALSIGQLPAEAGGADGGDATAHRQAARELFASRAEASARQYGQTASALGVPFRHVVRFGKPGEVIERICAELRRVEFVLATRAQKERERFSVSMPLFEVTG